MKMSKLYVPTLREVPKEAELVSHQLLLRAGMMRMLSSGVYNYLPLGIRVLKKIENIVREEMDAIDSQEILLSALLPSELWEESGRWEKFGPDMFKLKDRHGRDYCLGPTHEEIVTHLVRNEVKSYKQLPLSIYQIQTKFRDEKRPRFGLMRGREFLMKDAYTFDKDEDSMKTAYQEMWSAYSKVFERCELKFKVVEGDPGAMGGSGSHEFIALSDKGESEIFYCDKCDYAATDEEAQVVYQLAYDADLLELEKVSTPNVKTIEELTNFFKIGGENFAKMVIYTVENQTVAVLVPGNREINPIKLINHLGIGEHELEMASEEVVKNATSAETGFAGPINLAKDVRLIADKRITQMKNFIVGGNETDVHIKNVNYGRDFEAEIVDDLLLMVEGDNCPKCNEKICKDRGNEVGNIFQLGTKYSVAMGATYLDENGKEKPLIMGSHGIGISRTMASIIEQSHDENGIIWPLSVAPYSTIIVVANSKNDEQQNAGFELYEKLKSQGVEVLIDDRKERIGVKFKDAEIIGIPMIIVVGKGVAEGKVEYKDRRDGEKIEMTMEKAIETVMDRLAKVK